MDDEKTVFCNRLTNNGKVQIPLLKHRPRSVLLGRVKHHEHALLAFRQHHLVSCHVVFALRHVFQVKPDAQTTLVAHFHSRTGQAGRPHILNGDHSPGLHQFQRRFHQTLFGERIAHLHGGAFFLDCVVKFGRGHGGTTHAVAPGFGAQIHHGPSDARRRRIEDLVCIGETSSKCVHKAVAVVSGMKTHFATHGWYAKTIAIAADALDHAMHKLACLWVVFFTKAERVHRGHGTCAHGKDVA